MFSRPCLNVRQVHLKGKHIGLGAEEPNPAGLNFASEFCPRRRDDLSFDLKRRLQRDLGVLCEIACCDNLNDAAPSRTRMNLNLLMFHTL